jgi:hypothetical protein
MNKMKNGCYGCVAASLLFLSTALSAATITIVNNDGVNEGFNDPTPVAAVAGNPATTLGGQRLNAAQAAANAWGAVLTSTVEIRVGMQFDPLSCDATSAVLGHAGPTSYWRNFTGAPLADTWYPQALADSLAGSDRDPANPDISATFNSDLDFNNDCLNGIDWWYGIGTPAPAGTQDFFGVLLHEMAHGLGFLTLVDVAGDPGANPPVPPTGDEASGLPDAFEAHLEDHSLGLKWPAMTGQQRVTSSTDTGDLHWTGANAVAGSGGLTAGVGASNHIQMYAPAQVDAGSSVSHWDTALSPNELMEPFATPDLADLVTYQLFRDIGWTISGSVTGGGGGGDCSGDGVTVDLSARVFNSGEDRECKVTTRITAANGGIDQGANIRFRAPAVSLGNNYFVRGVFSVDNPAAPPPPCTPNTDVIVDGGFEAGKPNPNWVESSTNFGSPLCDANCDTNGKNRAFSGAWWVWFGGVNSAEEHGAVSQQVTIPTGSAQLQFQLWLPGCDSANDFLAAEIDGTEVFRMDGNSPLCGGGNYTQQLVDVSTFANGAQHTLQLRSSTFATNGNVSNIFVDEVKLMTCSP